MEELRKIYNFENLESSNIDIDKRIEEFFNYEEILNTIFDEILNCADDFDFSKSDFINGAIETINGDDKSFILFPLYLTQISKSSKLNEKITLYGLITVEIFSLGLLFTNENILLEDEKEHVLNQYKLYKKMIYDFTRKIQRIFTE